MQTGHTFSVLKEFLLCAKTSLMTLDSASPYTMNLVQPLAEVNSTVPVEKDCPSIKLQAKTRNNPTDLLV
jgi:hypothetical protein